jgi:hypothetical protein
MGYMAYRIKITPNDAEFLIDERMTEIECTTIYNWYDCFEYDISPYIINVLVYVIENSNTHDKEKIYVSFEKIMSPILKKYSPEIDVRKRSLHAEKLCRECFEESWKANLTTEKKSGNKTQPVLNLVFQQQPFLLRMINNNTFMWIWGVLIFFGMIFVGYNVPVPYRLENDLTSPIWIAFFSYVCLAAPIANASDNLYCLSFVPIVIAVLVCLQKVLFPQWGNSYSPQLAASIAICTSRQWIYSALVPLLWLPVLWINHNRLESLRK